MSGDGSYAPKSPDLSALYSIAQAPSSSGPLLPSIPSPAGGPAYQHLQSPLHHQPSPQRYASHQQSFTATTPTQIQGVYFPPRTSSDPQPPHYSPPGQPRQQQDSAQDGAQPSSLLLPQSPALQQPYQQQPQQYFPPAYGSTTYQQYSPPQQHQSCTTQPAISLKTEPSSPVNATFQSPEGIDNMPPKRQAAAAVEASPAVAQSPVKTKFPTARIKRIMQADEEVGKVAQQTPIAVGKALEMFMVELVSKSADVARGKSSKRVTAQMLKQVVESDDQWDFLREIVSKVEPEKEVTKAAKPKPETDSDEDAEPKKKGKGGRKKKATG